MLGCTAAWVAPPPPDSPVRDNSSMICPMTIVFEQKGSAVRFRVHAQPRASRSEVRGEHDGALRVRIAAPPVEGAANRELTRFLAKLAGVAPSAVRVVSGESGRSKLVEIDGVEAQVLERMLLR